METTTSVYLIFRNATIGMNESRTFTFASALEAQAFVGRVSKSERVTLVDQPRYIVNTIYPNEAAAYDDLVAASKRGFR
jgi:hypothetical protein